MKKYIFLSIILIFTGLVFAVTPSPKSPQKVAIVKKQIVEIFYFHYSKRCQTCLIVESESKALIAALYPVQYKKGLIIFRSINLDEKSSDAIAEKCKAEGQSLLVISGSKKTDLTDKAFLFAKSNPSRLKNEFKKTIDPLL